MNLKSIFTKRTVVIALAVVITASAYWPIRAVLRNDGNLRRRLWRGIGA